jgi:hypothetical protein
MKISAASIYKNFLQEKYMQEMQCRKYNLQHEQIKQEKRIEQNRRMELGRGENVDISV